MAKWEELPIADRAQYMKLAVQNGYRDIRSIREAYNIYAEGGPEDENSINPKWNSENYYSILGVETPFVDISRGAQKSQNFVTAYYNSPGFEERLSKHINTTAGYTDKYGSAPVRDITKPNKIKFPKVKEKVSDQGSYYDPTSNTIFIDKEQLAGQKHSVEDIGVFNTEQITSHEFGHSLDSQMTVNSPAILDYSLTYPQLRKFSNSNNENTEHDKRPSEIYADLIAMRDMLYRSGIFNSLKQNSKNPFTKKHLKAFKKANPNFRMFNNFTDDEIINLMNTVAYNPTYNIEYANQAAYGGNLFETGGNKGKTKKVGPTYNPQTKTWTNFKGQNITGKSFKGKYGVTTYLDSGAVDLDTNKTGLRPSESNHHWRYAPNAPRVYIGGSPNEARQKYFNVDTELTNTIKTIAKQYGISPSVLASRIAKEGPIDDAIRNYNNTNGYFQRGEMIGPVWGLDDMGTWITNGTVKLRDGLMVDTDYEMENEKGRTTYSVGSDNYMDGVELTAIALRHFKDQMRKKYPKASEAQLEQYATAAFNNGMEGAINLINQGKIQNSYKPFIQIKKNGGYVKQLLTKP